MGVSGGESGLFFNCKKVISEFCLEITIDEPQNKGIINGMKSNFINKEPKKDNNNQENDIFSEKTKYMRGKSPFFPLIKGILMI